MTERARHSHHILHSEFALMISKSFKMSNPALQRGPGVERIGENAWRHGCVLCDSRHCSKNYVKHICYFSYYIVGSHYIWKSNYKGNLQGKNYICITK